MKTFVKKVEDPDQHLKKDLGKIYKAIVNEIYIDGVDLDGIKEDREDIEIEFPSIEAEESYLEENLLDEEDLNYLSRVFKTAVKQMDQFQNLMDAKTRWESSEEDEIMVITKQGYRIMEEDDYNKKILKKEKQKIKDVNKNDMQYA